MGELDRPRSGGELKSRRLRRSDRTRPPDRDVGGDLIRYRM